jgi:hypothetical protein
MSDAVPLSSAKRDAASHARAQVAMLEKELGPLKAFLEGPEAAALARRLLAVAQELMVGAEPAAGGRSARCAYGPSRCMAHQSGGPLECWVCGRKDSCWLSGEY